MIPRILHSMWYDANDYDNAGPPEKYPKYHEYELTWRQLHSNWCHMFWNRRRVEELWEQPQLKPWREFFNSLKRLIEKCDYSRYAILWLYGGVYHDLDMVPVKSMSSLLENREFGWSYEPKDHVNRTSLNRRYISNSFLFSTPGHWVWPKLMDFITHHYDADQSPVMTTGPGILMKFAESINLMSEHPDYFIETCLILPLDKGEQIAQECPSNSLTQAYSYTRWNEGTNWNVENNLFYRATTQKNIILTLGLIVLLFVLIVYFNGS